MIVRLQHASLADLVDRFPDLKQRYEVVTDRRQRRSDADPAMQRHDRRRTDVSERLRTDGWVVVPAARRGRN
jgi:hypothetical protein